MEPIFRRPSAILISAFFVCAAAMSYFDDPIRFIALVISSIIFIGTLVFCICRRSRASRSDKRLAVLCLSVGLVIGALFSAFAFNIPQSARYGMNAGACEYRGTVLGKLWSSGSYSAYKLRAEIADGTDFNMLATCPDPSLEIGDVIRFEGELLSLEDGQMADMERYLRSEGIVGYTELGKVTLDGKAEGISSFIAKVRMRLSSKITTFVEGEGGAFVCALVTGDRSGLSGYSRLDFERLGIAHLLAISGIHLSVIFTVLSAVLPFTPLGKRRGAALLIPFIFIYMGLSGFSPSVVRAGTMMAISCALRSYGKRRDSFSVLAVSVAVISLFDPQVFFDTGFLLSVLSVCGVLWFTAIVSRKPNKDRHIAIRILFWIITAAAVTLATSLFTLPIIILEFGYISVVSPIANVVFIPLVTGVLYLTPLLIFAIPFPGAASFAGNVIGAYADMILDLADWASSGASLTHSVRYPFFLPISILAIIGAVLLVSLKPKSTGISILAISCVLAFASVGSVEGARRNTASITALSESGGDMLCVTDGADMMLIDMTSGTSGMLFEGIAYGRDSCITEIDHYVLTHYHSRHVTMISTLLSEVYVDKIWLPVPIGREEIEISVEIINAVVSAGARVQMIDREIRFGDVTFTPWERCWTGQSVESVHRLRISAYGKTADYYSGGYWNASEDFRHLAKEGPADVLIYGGHGPKYSGDIDPPEKADVLVFLGASIDHFPAEKALALHDGGTVIAGAGETIWWTGYEWENGED